MPELKPHQARLPRQRQRIIVEILASNGWVTTQELVTFFKTSDATVRRDLTQLVRQGLAVRLHGGATLPGQAAEAYRS